MIISIVKRKDNPTIQMEAATGLDVLHRAEEHLVVHNLLHHQHRLGAAIGLHPPHHLNQNQLLSPFRRSLHSRNRKGPMRIQKTNRCFFILTFCSAGTERKVNVLWYHLWECQQT